MKPTVRAQPVHDERADLAAAIAEREAASRALEQAARTLDRATLAVEKAGADLAAFDGLDDRIASARAEMFKSDECGPLPSELTIERKERGYACGRFEESKAALALLERERTGAEQVLREATQAVTFQAHVVLLREAVDLGEELYEAKLREWSLTHRLTAFEQMLGVGLLPVVRVRLLQTAGAAWARSVEALRMAEPDFAPNLHPVRLAAARWREALGALEQDANALLGE